MDITINKINYELNYDVMYVIRSFLSTHDYNKQLYNNYDNKLNLIEISVIEQILKLTTTTSPYKIILETYIILKKNEKRIENKNVYIHIGALLHFNIIKFIRSNSFIYYINKYDNNDMKLLEKFSDYYLQLFDIQPVKTIKYITNEDILDNNLNNNIVRCLTSFICTFRLCLAYVGLEMHSINLIWIIDYIFKTINYKLLKLIYKYLERYKIFTDFSLNIIRKYKITKKSDRSLPKKISAINDSVFINFNTIVKLNKSRIKDTVTIKMKKNIFNLSYDINKTFEIDLLSINYKNIYHHFTKRTIFKTGTFTIQTFDLLYKIIKKSYIKNKLIKLNKYKILWLTYTENLLILKHKKILSIIENKKNLIIINMVKEEKNVIKYIKQLIKQFK